MVFQRAVDADDNAERVAGRAREAKSAVNVQLAAIRHGEPSRHRNLAVDFGSLLKGALTLEH